MEEDLLPPLIANGLEKVLANPAIKDYDVAENLSNHAIILKGEYEIYGESQLLETAVQLARLAVEAMPDGHFNKMFPLNNLAAMLHLLFQRTHDTAVLTDAARICKQIVDETPEDDGEWTGRASNLSVMYEAQYNVTGDTTYLKQGIELMRRVVGITSEDVESSGGLNRIFCIVDIEGARLV